MQLVEFIAHLEGLTSLFHEHHAQEQEVKQLRDDFAAVQNAYGAARAEVAELRKENQRLAAIITVLGGETEGHGS